MKNNLSKPILSPCLSKISQMSQIRHLISRYTWLFTYDWIFISAWWIIPFVYSSMSMTASDAVLSFPPIIWFSFVPICPTNSFTITLINKFSFIAFVMYSKPKFTYSFCFGKCANFIINFFRSGFKEFCTNAVTSSFCFWMAFSPNFKVVVNNFFPVIWNK